MKQFSAFGITPTVQGLIGEKIKIDRIVNKKITVFGFRIEKSIYEKGNGKRLDLQIEVDGVKRVVFTSSVVLQDMIQKVPSADFPFETTIVKENDRFEFT